MKREKVLATLAAVVFFGITPGVSSAQARDASAVRVRVRFERATEIADVSVERRGTWTVACRAPCELDAAPGERVRVDVHGHAEQPLVSTVPHDGARAHDIEVRRRGRGLLVGGLAAIAAGTVSLAIGAAMLRSRQLFPDVDRAFGGLLAVLGASSVITGTTIIVMRSTAPVLADVPPTRSQALEDLVPARAVVAHPSHAAPFQLVWAHAF